MPQRRRNPLLRYMHWLHTGWPAGTVERLPEVHPDGSTAVPGLYVTGDLTGVPLLKFACDSGARAVQTIVADPAFVRAPRPNGVLDLVIVGAGVSGMAAALEAEQAGLRYAIVEAAQPFSTLVHLPRGKPIYTYPQQMRPAGRLQVSARVKEALLEELYAQTAGIQVRLARVESVRRQGGLLCCHLDGGQVLQALRVIMAIGRSGHFRRLGVPGEDLAKVYHRLHDPMDWHGHRALVVGGGDSAVEAAIALAECGAEVTLAYRKSELVRPKPDNLERLQRLAADPTVLLGVEPPRVEHMIPAPGALLQQVCRPGRLTLQLSSHVREIRPAEVVLEDAEGRQVQLPNDVVFVMIGREAPLGLLRRAGVRIAGDWSPRRVVGCLLFLALCLFIYSWKGATSVREFFRAHGLFPFNLPALGEGALGRTLTAAVREPGFHYSLVYTLLVLVFGVRRMRRRPTPYIRRQTLTLMAVQTVPLFVLPYLVLPWLGQLGLFSSGLMKTVGDNLFPDGSYWRACGLILAWPLFVWNVFHEQPLTWWLIISVVQTFVLLPLLVWRWGKGAYCGWICSCGALAETLGDDHRHRMPHGPLWNRLNMLGQLLLAICLVLLLARIASWVGPSSALGQVLGRLYHRAFFSGSLLDYYHVVDLFLAGVVGLGCYFWFSGRVWCRFACPLAALMHIYARFSRFRIFADKKKCISCNVCTSVCHQGIDVMSFANRGLPMQDPECVRCSACVYSCPTGVLTFGQADRQGGVLSYDRTPASLVQIRDNPAARRQARKHDTE
ncbi:MAG: NAD(P)-binding domain-containing protein [Myxococcales bacterium]|nr:NAD(P)-binding domain-containing protein [Myxococcota bacterium]MDW8283448.1 NAD(P)-binding domain-containing protein [Myxococcales bacterium]